MIDDTIPFHVLKAPTSFAVNSGTITKIFKILLQFMKRKAKSNLVVEYIGESWLA